MPQLSIVFGVLLCVLGVGTYAASDTHSVTALIPAFFGLPLMACGAVVLAKPDWRKHAMHVAAVIGLLGFLGAAIKGVPGLFKLASGAAKPMAVGSQIAMAVLCAAFVALCVRSFIAARKARNNAA